MAKRFKMVARCIAALALMLVYGLGMSAAALGAPTRPAQVRGGGLRGGGAVRGGMGRVRGNGRGVYVRRTGCAFNARLGRYTCPY